MSRVAAEESFAAPRLSRVRISQPRPSAVATFLCRSAAFLFIASLHLEITQRHALVELCILDVKLNVVLARLWYGQVRDIDAGDFPDAAGRLDDRLARAFGPHCQSD